MKKWMLAVALTLGAVGCGADPATGPTEGPEAQRTDLGTSIAGIERGKLRAGAVIEHVLGDRLTLVDLDEVESTGVFTAVPGSDENEPPHSMALSGGVDNRVIKPVGASYPYNDTNLRRIGEVVTSFAGVGTNYCTGVLVGRRLMLTAARCIYQYNTSSPSVTFTARRSGASAPWGTVTGSTVWTSASFFSLDCDNDPSSVDCVANDWALVLIPTNAYPGTHPGFMGYAATSDATLRSWSYLNDGYPSCNPWRQDRPSPCVDHTAYGWGTFTFGGVTVPMYSAVDPDVAMMGAGWFAGNHDASLGHEGGPAYSYSPGGGIPYVIGISSQELCYTCGPTDYTWTSGEEDYPVLLKRMDAALSALITAKRTAYP